MSSASGSLIIDLGFFVDEDNSCCCLTDEGKTVDGNDFRCSNTCFSLDE